MQTFSLEAQTDAHWDGLATRLKPILGDVAEVFGKRWRNWIGQHFNKQDFVVAQAALARKASEWFVLEWQAGAGGARLNDDWVQAGTSAQECVAHLLERITTEAIWPDRVQHDEVAGRTEFWCANKLFAVIRPLTSDGAASTDTGLVERLMLGLRATYAAQAEFARRIAWEDGLGRVATLTELPQSPTVPVHLPCLIEWLYSAKELLAGAGLFPCDESAEALVAAVFGAPSWSYLSECIGHETRASECASIGSPFYVWCGDASDHASLRVHARLDVAMGDFLTKVRSYEGQFGQTEAYVSMYADGRWHAGTVVPDPSGAACPLLASVNIEPVRRIEASARWVERVAKACGRDYLQGLQALFMVNQTPEQRLKFSAAETDRLLVAIDGAWTFLLDDELEGRPTSVWMLLTREDGVHRRTCNVRLDDMQLREFMGDLVVTKESDGRIPVAILKGLAPATVRKLCALCHGSYALPELEPDELSSNTTFYGLCESCTKAGALALMQ